MSYQEFAATMAPGAMIGTNKILLVVGLFNTAERLEFGLAALGIEQLNPSQIKVLAKADALNGVLDDWLNNGEAKGFGAWIVCLPTEEPISWALVTADHSHADVVAEQDARSLLGFDHQVLRRHAQQLDRHLRAGGALLLVEPHSDAEEWAACRALLNHASGGVQTHEINRSRES